MSPVQARYPAPIQVGEGWRFLGVAPRAEIAIGEGLQEGCSKRREVGGLGGLRAGRG
jgi:hypothetical protein